MPKFKPYNHDQLSMVVINFEDQIQPGTFEYAIHYLIEHKLDLSVFFPNYKNDDIGRPAYDPAILLKIILFAYSKGITSSREIQWCCETNIIFKALSCDSVPHFTTIASFVSSHAKEVESLFEQVLLVCDQQGLLGKELFAIDGCKMPSNVSKEHSGTYREMAEKRDKIRRQINHHLKEHQRLDAMAVSDEDRKRRIEQTITTLDHAANKIDAFLECNEPRMGRGRTRKEVKSNITDNESAKMKTNKGVIQGYNGVAAVDKKHQVVVDAQAFGEVSEHHLLAPVLEAIESRLNRLGVSKEIYKTGTIVTADTGFANEANMKYLYEKTINAYVPDNQFRSRDPKFINQKKKYGKRHQDELPKSLKSHHSKQVIPATEFDFDPVNRTCRCPAGEMISYRGERESPDGKVKAWFEGRLLQCRNCNLKHQCMKNPSAADHRKGAGRQVSFMLAQQRKTNYTDWMKHRVDSDYGKRVYSHRMSVVEPVFGNIATNKGLNRFSLRGKTKVQSQWQLYCMVHNIEKLMRYGQLAA